MDDDVDMEEDEEDQGADEEEREHDNPTVVAEIKPPDASAPMKIVKDYTPKGKSFFFENYLISFQSS